MKSKRSQEGYLLIDNRMGPGVTEEMVRAAGKDPSQVAGCGEGAIYESATITCTHCQVIVVLNPARTRPRGYCAKCDHYICDNPICNKECQPLNMILDVLQDTLIHNPHINPNNVIIRLDQPEPVKEQIKKIIITG